MVSPQIIQMQQVLSATSSRNSCMEITFSQAINLGLKHILHSDQNSICYGLGINDPKRIFGTTKDLVENFGEARVFDTPTSENAMTGIGVGAAIMGHKVIMTHQRLDFFLLAMDQLVNSAAKYHYMYGGILSVPITIRLIIGRGWGQGPTHSQNLQAWFAHIPGLKIVSPTTPQQAYSMLIESANDPNPVVFLEHRWLHNTKGNVKRDKCNLKIGKSLVVTEGNDITIVASSYLTLEATRANQYTRKVGISCELIDLISIKPYDIEAIANSVKKTGRLLVLDPGMETCCIGNDIITKVINICWEEMKTKPRLLAMPDCPEPTSYGLTKDFYIRDKEIYKEILSVMGINNFKNQPKINEPEHHDIPGEWFNGPF